MYEHYIHIPALTDDINQCQIFHDITFYSPEETSYNCILLTAECDIFQEKCDYYTIAAILPFDILFSKQLEKMDIQISNFKNDSLTKGNKKEIFQFLDYFLNNRFERYHWLGDLPSQIGWWYIDFSIIQTIDKSHKDKLLENRFAKLDSPLKESVFVKFSNYLGRVGLPTEKTETEALAQQIFDQYKVLPSIA